MENRFEELFRHAKGLLGSPNPKDHMEGLKALKFLYRAGSRLYMLNANPELAKTLQQLKAYIERL